MFSKFEFILENFLLKIRNFFSSLNKGGLRQIQIFEWAFRYNEKVGDGPQLPVFGYWDLRQETPMKTGLRLRYSPESLCIVNHTLPALLKLSSRLVLANNRNLSFDQILI